MSRHFALLLTPLSLVKKYGITSKLLRTIIVDEKYARLLRSVGAWLMLCEILNIAIEALKYNYLQL